MGEVGATAPTFRQALEFDDLGFFARQRGKDGQTAKAPGFITLRGSRGGCFLLQVVDHREGRPVKTACRPGTSTVNQAVAICYSIPSNRGIIP